MPFFDKEKSKIKMVVLTKNGNPNKTFYSPVQQNRKPSENIIRGMIRRLKSDPCFNVAQVIHFYEAGQLILKVDAYEKNNA